eukprot:jgi/Mesvir1/8200/Mv12493-RA.1
MASSARRLHPQNFAPAGSLAADPNGKPDVIVVDSDDISKIKENVAKRKVPLSLWHFVVLGFLALGLTWRRVSLNHMLQQYKDPYAVVTATLPVSLTPGGIQQALNLSSDVLVYDDTFDPRRLTWDSAAQPCTPVTDWVDGRRGAHPYQLDNEKPLGLPLSVIKNACIFQDASNTWSTNDRSFTLLVSDKDSCSNTPPPSRFNIKRVADWSDLGRHTWLKGSALFLGCELRNPMMQCENIAHWFHDSYWNVLLAAATPESFHSLQPYTQARRADGRQCGNGTDTTDCHAPTSRKLNVQHLLVDAPGPELLDGLPAGALRWLELTGPEWTTHSIHALYDVLRGHMHNGPKEAQAAAVAPKEAPEKASGASLPGLTEPHPEEATEGGNRTTTAGVSHGRRQLAEDEDKMPAEHQRGSAATTAAAAATTTAGGSAHHHSNDVAMIPLLWGTNMADITGRAGQQQVMCADQLILTDFNHQHVPTGTSEARRTAAQSFRHAMLRRVGLPVPEEGRCPTRLTIYGRGDRPLRRIENFDEVVEYIRKATRLEVQPVAGFQTRWFKSVEHVGDAEEERDMKEAADREAREMLRKQLQVFSQADIFILPYGAAMTNVALMTPGATVVETSPVCYPNSLTSKRKICHKAPPSGTKPICWQDPGLMEAAGLFYYHIGGDVMDDTPTNALARKISPNGSLEITPKRSGSCKCPLDMNPWVCEPDVYNHNYTLPLHKVQEVLEQVEATAREKGCPTFMVPESAV